MLYLLRVLMMLVLILMDPLMTSFLLLLVKVQLEIEYTLHLLVADGGFKALPMIKMAGQLVLIQLILNKEVANGTRTN